MNHFKNIVIAVFLTVYCLGLYAQKKVYDIPILIEGLGGIEQTIDSLKWFNEETKRAGFPGLDLQITMWAINVNHSGFDGSKSQNPENDFVKKLGFTS
jgi:hypothetical protein